MAEKAICISQQNTKPIKILKWKVREGVTVSVGRILLLYDFVDNKKGEQRKLKSSRAGTVQKIFAQEGDTVKSGEKLLELKACCHPTIMNDMCAECGADLRKDDITGTASVPMIHSIPDLKVSEELAQKLGKADCERLLKDRKLVLLVDLDQTLIHTTNDNIPANMKDVYHFQLYGPNSPWYHTRLRPGTHKFLNAVQDCYELHICTFGARNYAHTIAMFLDPDQKIFSNRILSRDECFDPTSKKANLRALFPCGDDMVCIIDDREDVWSHASNLIHVKPYHFFQHTGDINAPPGLDKHENDEKVGVDLSKLQEKVKLVEETNGKQEHTSITNGTLENKTNSKEKEVLTDSCNGKNEENIKENENKIEKMDIDNEKGDGLDTDKDKDKNNTIDKGRDKNNTIDKDKDKNNTIVKDKDKNNTINKDVHNTLDIDKEENNTIDNVKNSEKIKASSEEQKKIEEQQESAKKSSENVDINIEKSTKLNIDNRELPVVSPVNQNVEDNKTTQKETESPPQKAITGVTNEKCIEEKFFEIEDSDDYLVYLEEILRRIHTEFYQQYDKMESGIIPDLKNVIPLVRSNILKGCNLVFSGLVPTHIKLEQSKAYQVARGLGAKVTQDLQDDSTHLVAVRPGTAKVNAGKRKKNLKIVTPDWLWCCAERWEHVDERIFPLKSRGSKNRHPPPHCSSPEHITTYPEHNTPVMRKRTPSGRFMDTINPLMSFSSADIADMDKEVEDILDDESDTSEDESSKIIIEQIAKENKIVNNSSSSNSSSSEESLTGEYPKGYKRKRRNNPDEYNSTEDESPSVKFRRGESIEDVLDIDPDTQDSDGSIEPPDEVDDGEWNMMGAALEREFLSNN